MSYTYLQEQGVESLAESFADIPLFALSKSTSIAERFCCKDNEKEFCQDSQFGMTLKLSMENHGKEKLTLFAAASPAKTYQLPGKALESKASAVDCGQKWPESFARYDHDLHLWKIPQCLLFGEEQESLETLPEWGITVNGELSALTTPVLITEEKESGSLQTWPTPCVADAKKHHSLKALTRKDGKSRMDQLKNSVAYQNQAKNQVGGHLNPDWVEWLMGWPIGWTDSEPSGMDKFRLWLNLHGKQFQECKED